MPERIKVAIAGNPNSGKTTIFNAITGARQHVANYPGVTVEIKKGSALRNGARLDVTDLPGTYSLTAYSAEELLARDYIFTQRPDVVVAVVDASNLERNLYLAVQLMEIGAPLVIALNMMDIAESRGLSIDVAHLSNLLGVAIVPTVGHKLKGIDDLVEAILESASNADCLRPAVVRYGADIAREIDSLLDMLSAHEGLFNNYPLRWLATSLLEDDSEVVAMVQKRAPDAALIIARAHAGAERIAALTGASAETALADRRYGFISGACQESVRSDVEARHIFSDKIDLIVTHRVLGLPILLGLMYVVFYLTFNVASFPSHWIENARLALSDWLRTAIPSQPYRTLSLQSLIVDGVLGGVGSVVQFLPNVMVLFLAIAALEDSGYMARAAFVMDHLMHKIGLHGKSFIPMILGFGCSVPAIMATRIIENRRDRITTMLVIPLMSCSGKYPTYALIVAAFFPLAWRGPALWFVYVLGIALAVGGARLLRSTLLRGESHALVMELPPYRMPTLRGLVIHMWGRSWMFVRKAGTVILAASILLWFLTNWPSPPRDELERNNDHIRVARSILESSAVGRFGKAIEPALKPLGLDWKVATALVGATAAKEIFVAQVGIVYGVAKTGNRHEQLSSHLQRDYSTLAGFALLLFTLVASPCIATIAVTRRESGGWWWALLQWAGLTVLGYVLALVAFQVGSFLSPA